MSNSNKFTKKATKTKNNSIKCYETLSKRLNKNSKLTKSKDKKWNRPY